MTSPPADDAPSGDSESTSVEREPTDETVGEPTAEQAEDSIEPPTESAKSSVVDRRPPAAGEPSERVADPQPTTTAPHNASDGPTAEPAVDSNWWYWVAAVPIYVVGGVVAGVLAAVLFVFGVAIDVGGGMGLATGIVVALLVVGTIGYALVGLALSIMFPVGIYLDAKALAASDVSWEPDAVLYVLVAAASVFLSAFTLSAVVAVYYLYRRNQAVGVP